MIGSAADACKRFMTCWQKKDWQGMAESTQQSWASKHKNAAAALETMLSGRDLSEIELVAVSILTPVLADIMVKVRYAATSGKNIKKRMQVRVVRESAPYRPDPRGRWGVNPISTGRLS